MPAADCIDSIDKLTAAAAEHGLLLRGCFAVGAGDDVPEVDGAPAAQLMLFGNAGSAMWAVFNLSDEYRDGRPDPLNRWSARIGEALAKRAGACALFPFGAPPRPFLQWGKRAEALQNSQLGMLIHPKFGLWHAYRFALAFAAGALADGERLDAPVTVVDGDICARCTRAGSSPPNRARQPPAIRRRRHKSNRLHCCRRRRYIPNMKIEYMLSALRRFANFAGQIGVVLVGAALIRMIFGDAALGASGTNADAILMAGIGLGLMVLASAAVAAGEYK